MAQHDYIIANAAGASFRADINNALAAIVSLNSGPNEPNPTYAYQYWAHTTEGLLKQRNAANNAWISLFRLDAAFSLIPPADGAVSTAKLADGAVSTAKLASVIAPNVSSINAGPLAGFRNLLVNANPLINQRGYVSGTATTGANRYTLDRWQVVTSGQSVSWTDSANVRTVTAPAGGVQQIIEGANIFSGTYTLNWTGTATASISGGAVAKGGSVTLVGGTEGYNVRFSNGTFSLPQLEPGPVATPFERRPIGTELALCQRYFYQPSSSYTEQSYASVAGANTYTQIYFPVAMRAVPTIIASWSAGTNAIADTIDALGPQGASAKLTSSALGEFSAVINWTSFTAEL